MNNSNSDYSHNYNVICNYVLFIIHNRISLGTRILSVFPAPVISLQPLHVVTVASGLYHIV